MHCNGIGAKLSFSLKLLGTSDKEVLRQRHDKEANSVPAAKHRRIYSLGLFPPFPAMTRLAPTRSSRR
jgi:hypothetical protein